MIFRKGDKVKLREDLINVVTYNGIQPNKIWRNRFGTVVEVSNNGQVKVRWNHLCKETNELADCLEFADCLGSLGVEIEKNENLI
jgi:hypothetical protein